MGRPLSQPLGEPVKTNGFVSYPVHAIHLRRAGAYVCVDVQRADGLWTEAIREPIEGPFSHEIMASGLDAREWRARGVPTGVPPGPPNPPRPAQRREWA